MNKKSIGLYIHFPFCKKRCLYCDFPTYSGRTNLMDKYLLVLKEEIVSLKNNFKDVLIDTVFLGGGTPTLFSGENIKYILKFLKENFEFSKNIEITIEANPETLDRYKLLLLAESGINRLSIGMQAAQDKILESLGRSHSYNDVSIAIKEARDVGFKNISLDLIYGLPNQSLRDWTETLTRAVELDVEHISAYSLIIEPETVFYDLYKENKLNLPGEELDEEMYVKVNDFLGEMGFNRYEISNYSKMSFESKHNLIYWENNDYIGLGLGAHSNYNSTRWFNEDDIDRYLDKIEKGMSPIVESINIDMKEKCFESLMLGLRLTKGISKKEFLLKHGVPVDYFFKEQIDKLIDDGFIVSNANSLQATEKGLNFHNHISLQLLEEG